MGYPVLTVELDNVQVIVDDEGPDDAAPKLRSLQSVTLRKGGTRASVLLREMLPYCGRLQSLEILDCPSVNINSLSSVISSYRGKLTTLKIAGCGHSLDRNQARALVECCP